MNTEKQPGQHSNPPDSTQKEKDQQPKSGQQDREGYNQDRKPGQGNQGNVPEKDKKTA
jgi:hypothetical protein